MLEADFFEVQWAAVTTHCGWTKVPPQKVKPEDVLTWACHGQAPFGASFPPTIRAPGLNPHFRDSPPPPPPPPPAPPPPPPPPPPLPPPPQILQDFLQFSLIYCSYLPLQYPLLSHRGQFKFLSLHSGRRHSKWKEEEEKEEQEEDKENDMKSNNAYSKITKVKGGEGEIDKL